MTDDIKLIGVDLSLASEALIELLLEDPPGDEIYGEILAANRKRPEILRLLAEDPLTPEDIQAEAQGLISLPVRSGEKRPSRRTAQPQPAAEEEQKLRLLQKIQALTVGEKISLALKGGREVRYILAKDSNKEVVISVIKNPKVTATEAELVAHSRNVPDEVLRVIAKNREWMKNYGVVLALVNNPKTPPAIAMSLVPGLKKKDITTLEKNKNVAEGVRLLAKKIATAKRPS